MSADAGTAAERPGSTLSTRRELLVGGALASAALVAGGLRLRATTAVQPAEGQLDRMVPERIGDWTRMAFASVLIPVGEAAEDRSYDDVLTRYYRSPDGSGVMLLIAYSASQAGETALHRPEVCYPAAGFRLKRWPDVRLSFPAVDIAAATMTASAPGRIEQLLYWSRIGTTFPTTSTDQRLTMVRQSLSGQVPDGALIRLSTINPDRAAAMGSLERFASQLMQSAGADLRLLMTGRA